MAVRLYYHPFTPNILRRINGQQRGMCRIYRMQIGKLRRLNLPKREVFFDFRGADLAHRNKKPGWVVLRCTSHSGFV